MPSCSEFTVSTVPAGPWAVITPAGEIDIDSAPDLERALHDCLDHHPSEVHLDLYAVRLCDRTGRAIVHRLRRVDRRPGP
ncbi:STAS domain-containing protein [Embleya scabrispora]|uniref:STAS domain-containing protein n=1 Tax=Embleya scabrispora TaxID=159449 RepID=UPI00035F20C1